MSIIIDLCLLSVLIFSATTQNEDGVAISINPDKIILENESVPISYEVSCQVGNNITEVLNMTLTNRENSVVIINSNVTDTKTTGYYDGGYVTSNLSAGYLKIEFVDVSPQIHFGSFTCAVVGRSGAVILRIENTATLRHISMPMIEINKTQLIEQSKLIVTCTATAACIEVNLMTFSLNHYTINDVNISSSSTCERLTTTQSAVYNVNETFYCSLEQGLTLHVSCSVVYTSNITEPRRRRYLQKFRLVSDTYTAYVGSAFGEECRYNSSCVTESAFCDITLPKPICTCPAGLHFYKEFDMCSIERCPEDSSYIYSKDINACYTFKSRSTNDSWDWDKVCTEQYAVALPFSSSIKTQLIKELQSEALNFIPRCNQSMSWNALVISTNHSLDEMNKPQWFLPSGERLDINPEPESGWVSSPSSCLYMSFDGRIATYHVSSDCNLTEPYKGCFIQLPNSSCEYNIDELHQYTWNYTRAGIQVNQSCPNTREGQVTRECQANGVWKSPLFNCTLKSLTEILD